MATKPTKIKNTEILPELAAGDHLLVESGGMAKRIPASALKQPGLVFDSVEDMETYIAAHADKLAVGMDLFIREEDAPDYWWDGTKAVEVETDLSVVKADIAGLKTGVETNSKEIGKISDEIADELNNIRDIETGKNLANPDEFEIGFLRNANGNIDTTLTNYITTDFIPVELGKSYSMSVYSTDGFIAPTRNTYLLYDANKEPIADAFENIDNTRGLVATVSDERAKYIRCSGNVGVNNVYMVAESNSVPNIFEAYLSEYVNKMKIPELEDLKKTVCDGLTIYNFGDSIGAGGGNNGIGYAEIIGEVYGANVTDYAVGGSTISKIEGQSMGCILDHIENASSVVPDVIFLEGGANDYTQNRECGNVSVERYFYTLSNETSLYWKPTTYIGALELAFHNLKVKYPTAKIVWIFVHKHERITKVENDITYDFTEMHDKSIACAKKWGVEVVDMYESGNLNTRIQYDKTHYTGNNDGTHPNDAGYRRFYIPKIRAKLDEMLKYDGSNQQ